MGTASLSRRARRVLRDRGGASLAVVLCLGALLAVLAAALVQAASVPAAGADRRLAAEDAYQRAVSFSDLLDAELTAYTGDDDGSLGAFLNGIFLVSGSDYADGEEYTAEMTDNDDAVLTVTVCKTPEADAADGTLQETFPLQEYAPDLTGLADLMDQRRQDGAESPDAEVAVTVTAAAGGETYAATRRYAHYGNYALYCTVDADAARYDAWQYADGALRLTRQADGASRTLRAGEDAAITLHWDLTEAAEPCRFARADTQQEAQP